MIELFLSVLRKIASRQADSADVLTPGCLGCLVKGDILIHFGHQWPCSIRPCDHELLVIDMLASACSACARTVDRLRGFRIRILSRIGVQPGPCSLKFS